MGSIQTLKPDPVHIFRFWKTDSLHQDVCECLSSAVIGDAVRPGGLKRSPPASPVSAVWSSDSGSLRFSRTALTGVSPAERDRPWRPAAASEWRSEPARHIHIHAVTEATHTQTHTVDVQGRCVSPTVLVNTQYLHALQLLFAEGVLFLQRLILNLHADELPLHLRSLILQLQRVNHTHTHTHTHRPLLFI